MEFDLLDRFGDRSALTKDTQFMLDLLNQIETAGTQTASVLKNIKFTSSGNSGLESQIKSMKEFATATDNYTKKVTFLAGQEAKLLELQKKQSDLNARQIKEKQALTAAENEVIKQISLEDKAAQQNIRTKIEQIKYEEALEKQKQRTGSQAAAEQKIAQQLSQEYYKLGQALKAAELEYKQLALTKGFDATETQAALQKALAMRDVLDKVDGNLRNHQRNVGNYKSAFDGLGMSFTQIARELPALAINMQTFLSAISNNLPMVFDEIGKAREEIAELNAQGEAAPSLFKRIMGSALSLNVFLSIGITLLTLFGAKFIDYLKVLAGAPKKNDEAAESVKRFLSAQLELIRTTKELRDLFKIAVTGTDKLEKELAIAQALNKSRGDQLVIEKELARVKAANALADFNKPAPDLKGANGFAMRGEEALSAYQQKLYTVQQNYYELVSKLADTKDKEEQDKLQKEVDRAKVSLDFYKERVSTQKQVINDFYKTSEELEKKQAEIETYNREQRLLKSVEYEKILQNTRVEASQRVLDDERNFADKRIAALKADAKARKKIIEADLRTVTEDPKNKNANGTFTSEALVAQKKANAEISRINLDLQVSIFNVQKEYRDRRMKAENDYLNESLSQSIDFNKKIIDSDYFTFAERGASLVDYMENKRRLIVADYGLELLTKVHTDEELKALEKKKQRELNDLVLEGAQIRSAIVVSSGVQEYKAFEAAQSRMTALQKFINAKFISNKVERAEANRKLDYEAKRKELELEIQHQQDILNASDATPAAKVDAQNELNKKMAELYGIDTDNYLSEQERKMAGLAKFKDQTLQVVDLLGMAQNIDYVRTRNQIRDEQDAAEKKAARDIEIAAITSATEEEKASKIAIINARLQAQKDAFARREREAEMQKAKFEKARTMFTIGLEIAKAFAEFNYFGAAIGIAQLAIVAATPIPRYFKGKKKGEKAGHMAWVDDGATGTGNAPEAIKRADGSIEIGSNKPRLSFIGDDDEVIPDAMGYLKSIYGSAFREPDAGGTAIEDNTQRLLEAQAETNMLLKSIADKPVQIIEGSEKGVKTLLAWASRQVEHINDMTNF